MPMKPSVVKLFHLSCMHRLLLSEDLPMKENFIYLCRKVDTSGKEASDRVDYEIKERKICASLKEKYEISKSVASKITYS